MVLTLSDISKKYSVSSQTLKRVVSKNEETLQKYITRGIRNRIEFTDNEGVECLMGLVASQTRWSPEKTVTRKKRKSRKKQSPKRALKDHIQQKEDLEIAVEDKKEITETVKLSIEKQLIISLKDHNNSLKKQVEVHKEDKKRLVNQLNELQMKFSQVYQEKDNLLFEVAAWRGLYGKIEDQKALVPVDVIHKNSILSSLKQKISNIFSK